MTHSTSITEKQIEPEITLGSLVAEALDFVDGHIEKASERVYYKLMSDKPLLKQVIKSAISFAVRNKANQLTHDSRRHLIERVERHQLKIASYSPRERAEALANAISSCVLDMPLGSGRKLRDVGPVELRDLIERREKSASSHARHARFLRMILQSTPDGQHVGDCVTEERARELWEESSKETTP